MDGSIRLCILKETGEQVRKSYKDVKNGQEI